MMERKRSEEERESLQRLSRMVQEALQGDRNHKSAPSSVEESLFRARKLLTFEIGFCILLCHYIGNLSVVSTVGELERWRGRRGGRESHSRGRLQALRKGEKER